MDAKQVVLTDRAVHVKAAAILAQRKYKVGGMAPLEVRKQAAEYLTIMLDVDKATESWPSNRDGAFFHPPNGWRRKLGAGAYKMRMLFEEVGIIKTAWRGVGRTKPWVSIDYDAMVAMAAVIV
jgi:hypothetical protein